LEKRFLPETDGGSLGVPSCWRLSEGKRRRRRNWANATDELPGILENDMSRKNNLRKHGTSRRSPRPAGTAKAPRITGRAGKTRRALERGGWGRLSVDRPEQHKPDGSEGPWSRAVSAAQAVVCERASASDSKRSRHVVTQRTTDESKLNDPSN